MLRKIGFGLIGAMAFIGLMLALPAAPMESHAVLVEAVPARGAAMATGPERIQLWFNEPVLAEFNPLAIYDRVKNRVDLNNAQVDPADSRRLTVGVKPLADGFYTVEYRVTSLDGHPIRGTYGFTVGPAAAVPPPAPGAAELFEALPLIVGVSHGAVQGLTVILAGLAMFTLLIWLPATEVHAAGRAAARLFISLGWLLSGLVIVVGWAELGLYAMRAAGEPFSFRLLAEATTNTRAGQIWWARAGIGLLSAFSLTWAWQSRRKIMRLIPIVIGLLLPVTLTAQSHAAAEGFFWPKMMDWLHMSAAAPWAAGLACFSVAMIGPFRRMPRAEMGQLLGRAVRRFSPTAIGSVFLLLITGLYASRLHIPGYAGLFRTAYGQALSAKLVLLVPVLVIGAVNLRQQGRGHFRRLVVIELALLLGVFVAAGFLTSLPPARAALLQQQGPYSGQQSAGPFLIELTITPTRVGYNDALIRVQTIDGAPVTAAGVGLRLTMPGHDMGRQNPEAEELGNGQYAVTGLVFGMDGPWHVEVVMLTAAGREARATFKLLVPPPQM